MWSVVSLPVSCSSRCSRVTKNGDGLEEKAGRNGRKNYTFLKNKTELHNNLFFYVIKIAFGASFEKINMDINKY